MKILFLILLACVVTNVNGQTSLENSLGQINLALNNSSPDKRELTPNTTAITKFNSVLDMLDPKLLSLLDGAVPQNLTPVNFAVEHKEIFFDSDHNENIFGYLPKEFLFRNSASEGDHIQINYQFPRNKETGNGYKPALDMVKLLTVKLGKPEVKWWENQIIFTWVKEGAIIKASQIESKDLSGVIVRLDMQEKK